MSALDADAHDPSGVVLQGEPTLRGLSHTTTCLAARRSALTLTVRSDVRRLLRITEEEVPKPSLVTELDVVSGETEQDS